MRCLILLTVLVGCGRDRAADVPDAPVIAAPGMLRAWADGGAVAPQLGCAPADGGAPADDAGTTGRVVDLLDGTPVSGATVALLSSGQPVAEATTGADGAFALAGLSPGRATLRITTADPERLGALHLDVPRGREPLELALPSRTALDTYAGTAGLTADPLEAFVLGTVRDCAGRPLESAWVGFGTPEAPAAARVLYFSETRPPLPIEAPVRAQTAANGRFFGFHVPPGTAELHALGFLEPGAPPVRIGAAALSVQPGVFSFVTVRP